MTNRAHDAALSIRPVAQSACDLLYVARPESIGEAFPIGWIRLPAHLLLFPRFQGSLLVDEVLERVLRHAEPEVLLLPERLPGVVDLPEVLVLRRDLVIHLERGL